MKMKGIQKQQKQQQHQEHGIGQVKQQEHVVDTGKRSSVIEALNLEN